MTLLGEAGTVSSGARAAIEGVRSGGWAVLIDDDERWPAHVVSAATRCDAAHITFLARAACGVVSLALTAERCDRLGLRTLGRAATGAVHVVSIEARALVGSGISAADRARTITVAVDPASGPLDIVSPGHVLPLRAGGRSPATGLTEAAIALSSLADQGPAAVVCAVLDDGGDVLSGGAAWRWAARHGGPVISTREVEAAVDTAGRDW